MTALVSNVSGADVAALIGRTDAAFITGTGQLAADLAREAASSYCRGVGFEDADQIPASLQTVVLLRAVRLVGNTQQLQSESRDGVALNYGAGATGFTVQEILALDEYRRKTASL